jgi:hypothetical protein
VNTFGASDGADVGAKDVGFRVGFIVSPGRVGAEDFVGKILG